MKKVLFIGLALLVLTSCKKDWTCECTSGDTSGTTTIKDMTRKDAKEECDKGDISIMGFKIECGLK